MTQCTKCNSPMIDNNPFDESEPEWVCEKCGGTDGYTPEAVTAAQIYDYVSADVNNFSSAEKSWVCIHRLDVKNDVAGAISAIAALLRGGRDDVVREILEFGEEYEK